MPIEGDTVNVTASASAGAAATPIRAEIKSPAVTPPAPIAAAAPAASPLKTAEPAPVVAAKPGRTQLALAAVLVRPFEPEPVATAGLNIARPKQLEALADHAELTAPPYQAASPITTVSLPEPEALSEREIVEVPQVSAPAFVPPAAAPQTPVTPKASPVPVAATPAPVPPVSGSSDIQNAVETPRPVLVALPRPKPPLTPAQRLNLHDKEYDKAEKCLAQAIYFEARNESVKGQEAVAQVVLNRVFSPYYPKDVCSVVYQNAHRYLSCQFTFACDGKPEAIRERGAWARASRIARQTLEAKIWLPEVNKATHYHASYVHPRWVRDMRVMVRYGQHTFYRPRNWGDGSHEAKWGTAAVAAKKPAAPASTAQPAKAGHNHAPATRSIRTRYWSRLRDARA
jgi:hypothetical protein